MLLRYRGKQVAGQDCLTSSPRFRTLGDSMLPASSAVPAPAVAAAAAGSPRRPARCPTWICSKSAGRAHDEWRAEGERSEVCGRGGGISAAPSSRRKHPPTSGQRRLEGIRQPLGAGGVPAHAASPTCIGEARRAASRALSFTSPACSTKGQLGQLCALSFLPLVRVLPTSISRGPACSMASRGGDAAGDVSCRGVGLGAGAGRGALGGAHARSHHGNSAAAQPERLARDSVRADFWWHGRTLAPPAPPGRCLFPSRSPTAGIPA